MKLYTHHTKDKGDSGLGHVIASLLSQGIQVALPLSEHLPFDLIAISKEGDLCRVSVKYRAKKKGKIEIPMRSCWSNAEGVHVRHLEPGEIDALAIYCPDTAVCYFLGPGHVQVRTIVLRIDPSMSGRLSQVKWACDFTDPSVIFGEASR